MSPSSLAGKELPGSYTLSDVFEFADSQAGLAPIISRQSVPTLSQSLPLAKQCA